MEGTRVGFTTATIDARYTPYQVHQRCRNAEHTSRAAALTGRQTLRQINIDAISTNSSSVFVKVRTRTVAYDHELAVSRLRTNDFIQSVAWQLELVTTAIFDSIMLKNARVGFGFGRTASKITSPIPQSRK